MKIKTMARLAVPTLLLGLMHVASAGEILRDKVESKILGRALPFTIYVPDGYYDSFDKYPAVYLLHGSGGDENVLAAHAGLRETLDALIRRRELAPMVAVMPAGGSSWWIDGAAEKMQSALITELIPYVENKYEVEPGRGHRAVAGISMGGFGALNLGLTHPELVCAAGLLSPGVVGTPPPESSARSDSGQFARGGHFSQALWDAQNYPALLAGYKEKKQIVPMYMESGDHDRQVTPITVATLFMALYAIEPQKVELRIVDGAHEWMTFRDALPNALRFINRQCRF